ncbi:hypothetical protein NDU88_005192 [Pleurodeles waltl]|uniref:Uncharacterized protein n=1 Tax=Pleurodeles waltl TaxID=8319 RepID=A0AAV7N3M6_PLEWA|nr:hypothetical protein NDU88_005192 [Pleurodeles waltl]
MDTIAREYEWLQDEIKDSKLENEPSTSYVIKESGTGGLTSEPNLTHESMFDECNMDQSDDGTRKQNEPLCQGASRDSKDGPDLERRARLFFRKVETDTYQDGFPFGKKLKGRSKSLNGSSFSTPAIPPLPPDARQRLLVSSWTILCAVRSARRL